MGEQKEKFLKIKYVKFGADQIWLSHKAYVYKYDSKYAKKGRYALVKSVDNTVSEEPSWQIAVITDLMPNAKRANKRLFLENITAMDSSLLGTTPNKPKTFAEVPELMQINAHFNNFVAQKKAEENK